MQSTVRDPYQTSLGILALHYKKGQLGWDNKELKLPTRRRDDMDAQALQPVQGILARHLGRSYGSRVGRQHPVTLPSRPVRQCSYVGGYDVRSTFGKESCIFHVNILIFRNFGCFREEWSLGDGKATSF